MIVTGRTPKYSEEKTITVPFSPSQIPHGLNLGLNPSLRGGIPATEHLNRDTVRFIVIYKQNNWAFRVKLTN